MVDIAGGRGQQVVVSQDSQSVEIGLAIDDVALLVEATGVGPPGPPGPTGPAGQEGLTEQDVNDLIADYINNLPVFQADPASTLIATRLAEGNKYTGHITLGVAADSTLNDGGDGIRIWLDQLAVLYPELCIKYGLWSDATKTMQTPLATLQAGVLSPTGGGTNVITDAFTRTDASLVGDTADTGQTWQGAGAAVWATNGTAAYPSTSPTGSFALVPTGVVGDMAVRANVTLNAAGAVAKSFLLVSNLAGTGNYVWAQVSVSAIGAISGTLWKRIGSTPIQLASFPALGLAANGTHTFDMTLTVVGTNVVATIGSVQASGVLVPSDLSVLGGQLGFSSSNSGTANSVFVNSFAVDLPVLPASVQTMTVYNGATPGQKISYHTQWFEGMFPVPPDVVLMSSGHNNGMDTPFDYQLDCDTFVNAVKAVYPEVLILAASQNPEFPPAGTIVAHLARQRSLPAWAIKHRHGYVPITEAYRSAPDGGASRVQADGIHPTTGPEPDKGAYLFATTLQTHIANAEI